jgi:hypothetical protein
MGIEKLAVEGNRMAQHVDEVVAIVDKEQQNDLFELVVKRRRVYALIL